MAKRGFSGVLMRAYGATDHEATVTRVENLTEDFLRIWFVSETLLQDAAIGPTAYLRFWFPNPEQPDVEQQRSYTVSEADPATGTFAIDVLLHTPAGPGSAWAKNATAGQTISVTSLGSKEFVVPEELPAGYLIVGDAASIPAINAILSELPPQLPAEVYLEQARETDRDIPLAQHPRAEIHWVQRTDETSLADSIAAQDWSNWAAWLATESGSLKHLRKRLRDDFGFPKQEITAQAYWYWGRAFGKNRSKTQPMPLDTTTAEAATTESAPKVESAPAPEPTTTAAVPRGNWHSTGGRKLLAPLKPTIIAAAIIQVLLTLIELAPFVLLTELARQLLIGASTDTLTALGIWAAVLLGAGVFLNLALTTWLHWVDARYGYTLRRRLLDKLARLPLGWFTARGSGQVKQLVQDDTLAMHYLVTHAVPDAAAAITAPIAVFIYLFIVDWRLALLLLLPVVAYLAVMAVMVVKSGPKAAESMRWVERMNTAANSYLEGQPVIRVFGGATASHFQKRLHEYIAFLSDWQRPLAKYRTFLDLVTRPTTFLLLTVVFGALFISIGIMEPLAILPFLILAPTFGTRLLGIGYGLGDLRTGLLAARHINTTLEEAELDTLPAPENEAVDTPGRVVFDDVTFGYLPGLPVIKNVSLTLEPGTVTALVGSSGSGKSTLAALLARFYDVDTGSITISGRDLRRLSPDELYRQIGFVLQDVQLVDGTLRENIALAVPDANDAQIESAARAAQIHDRISALPDGYATRNGEQVSLSGGEQQRVTIARVILADTEVLVLDEATSFADPESEHLVQAAIDELTADRTVLVIAHRLHTITGVDQIVVLNDGQIVETGTHDELLALRGHYHGLWLAGHPTTDPIVEGSR